MSKTLQTDIDGVPSRLSSALVMKPRPLQLRIVSGRARLWAGLLALPILSMAAGAAHALDLQVNHEVRFAGNPAPNPNDGPVGGTYTYRTSSGVNDDSGSVANAVLRQNLPDNAIFQSISAPLGVSCTGQPAVGQPIGTAVINCTFPTLSAGAPQIVDFNVILPAESTSNVASVSLSAAGNADGNSTNDDNITRNVTTYERADLAVEITGPADGSAQQNGTVVNYLLQVRNTDWAYAYPLKPGEKAVVRFPLPASTTWQSSPSGNDWSCVQSMDDSAAPPVSIQTCEYTAPAVDGVPKNTDLPLLTIPVTVNADSGNTDALVSVTGQTTGGASFIDAQPDNNVDEVRINFTPNTQLDMVLAKSVVPTTLDKLGDASRSVVYTLKATRNSGLLTPAGIIRIIDTLPSGVSFDSVTTDTAGWNCAATGQDLACNFTGTVNIDGSLPDLAFNADVNVGGVTVDSGTGTARLSNTAKLSVENEPTANTGNNSATASLTVSNRPSLTTTKAARAAATGNTGIGAIADGTEFFWRIAITNNGTVDVRDGDRITVTDALDPKLEYRPDGAEDPWECSATPTVWTASTPQTVTCTLDSGIPSTNPDTVSNLNIKVRARIPLGEQWATISNEASVSCPENRNCATGSILTNRSTVNLSDRVADLSITKTAAITANSSTYGPSASGAEVVYTLRVKNAVPNPLPDEMTAGDFQTAKTVTVHDVVTNLLQTDVNAAAHSVTGTPRYSNNRFLEAELGAPLPNGVTGSCDYHTTAAGGGALPANSVRVTCTLNNVPVGEDEYPITIKARQFVNPTSSADQTGSITNTATVSSPDTAEHDGSNNSDGASVTLTALTNLIAGKTAAHDEALAGQPIMYTLGAQNRGPSQATAVRVVDTLPVGMIWVTAPNIATSGPDAGTCTLSGGGSFAAGQVVNDATKTMTCEWNNAAGVGARTLTYTLRSANIDYPPSVTNNAHVETTTQETIPLDDPDTDNTTRETVPLAQPQLDVLITMQHTADRLPINDGTNSRTRYTIWVQNSGNSTSYATNVVMEDLFPAPGSTANFTLNGSTVTGVRALAPNGNPVTPNRFSASNCAFSSSGLRCDFPWLAPGESAEITFEMDATAIDNNGLPYGTIRHEASVRADAEFLPGGGEAANNAVTDRTSAYDASSGIDPDDLRLVDLSITKTSTSTRVEVGSLIPYQLTVTNEEDPAATSPNHLVDGNARVVDVLPEGLELVGTAPTGCVYDAGTRTLECTIANLNAGASVSYNFAARVTAVASGQTAILNRATVTSPGDPVTPNNEDEETVSVADLDVSLAKSASSATVNPGQTLTYTLQATSLGAEDAQNVVISDTLPAGMAFVASPDGCTAAGNTVTCSIGTLAGRATRTMTFTARADMSVARGTTLTNCAAVQAPGDRNPANDQSCIDTTVPRPGEPGGPSDPKSIPTLSEWGLILLSLLMAGFALRRVGMAERRR